MSDWTAGYVADIGYTYGYYPELNPLRAKLAFINAGLHCPDFGTACELGFGQGLSANLHAAGSMTRWHGTDFNPAQAGFAQELAEAAGSGAQLVDQAFDQFCNREDLPDFDYIGLHGIWSWISDENRHLIVDFIRRKLKVGGVLYISYNTQPGWAAFAPMRHLLTEHADVIGAEGRGIINRIGDAVAFADKLLETNPAYLKANPVVADRVKRLKDQNRHYLAHEYFNRDWLPMHFSTMAEWLSSAKVDYACSAHYLDHIPLVNLTTEQQAFLKEIPDAMFFETVRDFMVNQQFRRDYWVKGARRLSSLAQSEAMCDVKVLLINHRPDVSLKVAGALGDAELNEPIYAPILDLLADHKPRTLKQIFEAVAEKGISFAQVCQSAIVLAGAGHIVAVQDEQTIAKAKKATDRLNRHLLQQARGSSDIAYLASPVSGGGTVVSRFHQLMLLARIQGHQQPAEWAAFVWKLIASQGQSLVKEGKTLETPEENLAELTAQAKLFADKLLPILKALGIA